jgi:hypothetical protein
MKLIHSFSPEFLTNVRASELVYFRLISITVVKKLLIAGVEPIIGYRGLANVLTQVLGIEIEHSPGRPILNPGEQVVVAHYRGSRLNDRATVLPDGSRLRFYIVMPIAIPNIMTSTEAEEMGSYVLDKTSSIPLDEPPIAR